MSLDSSNNNLNLPANLNRDLANKILSAGNNIQQAIPETTVLPQTDYFTLSGTSVPVYPNNAGLLSYYYPATYSANQQINSNIYPYGEKFSGKSPSAMIASSPDLIKLFGGIPPEGTIPGNITQKNVEDFLANSDPTAVKSGIQALIEYFIAIESSEQLFKVTGSSGQASALTYSTGITTNSFAAYSAVTSEDIGGSLYSPNAENLRKIINYVQALLNDSEKTGKGGSLEHLEENKPLLIQELQRGESTIQQVAERRTDARATGNAQKEVVANMNKPVENNKTS